MRQALYGHTSEATAYRNEDYPYGSLRCVRLCWIEYRKNKGFRFCYRTINPKNGKLNAVKTSTYCMLAGNLYLDENGHTMWAGISEYSDANVVADYLRDFPQGDLHRLTDWVKLKILHYTRCVSGQSKWTINGVVQEPTPGDIARYKECLAEWQAVLPLLPMKATQDNV